MNNDEDYLGEYIAHLMCKGVNLAYKNGRLTISGYDSAVNRLGAEDLCLLKDRKNDIVRLISVEAEEVEIDADCHAAIEGRLLAKHLVPLWRNVDSGELDATFTNMTHSVSRLPTEIEVLQFVQAARWVVARHPALRLTFTSAEHGSYRLGLVDVSAIDIHVENVLAATTYDALKVRASEIISKKLDSKRGMVRPFLLKGKGCALLGVIINHFVSDLRSVEIITQELTAACYGHQVDPSAQSAQAEYKFIRELTESYDYGKDPRFAVARAFWRGIVSEGRYRKGCRTTIRRSRRVTKIEFSLGQSILDRFAKFAADNSLTYLGLIVAIHAKAQHKVFGYSTTVMIVTARDRPHGSRFVGKLDNVKPINVEFDDVIACARRVGRYRKISNRLRYIPYDVFSEIIYNGKVPLTPFINLIVHDNVGKHELFGHGKPTLTRRTEVTTYESGAEQRLDFEDYSLQVVIKKQGINGVLAFSHNNLSVEDGECLVKELMDAFENI